MIRKLIVIQDVRLGLRDQEVHTDAILDTGSTYCVIPEEVVSRLNLQSRDQLGIARIQGILGQTAMTDRYHLEYMRVGTSQAYGIDILVGEAVLGLMLIGMSFIEHFTTTLDLDEERVVFRSRIADRE